MLGVTKAKRGKDAYNIVVLEDKTTNMKVRQRKGKNWNCILCTLIPKPCLFTFPSILQKVHILIYISDFYNVISELEMSFRADAMVCSTQIESV